MKRFKNQVAMVVGGARGIGRSIARRLVYEGAKVAVLDVLENDMEKLADDQVAHSTFSTDVTDAK